MTETKAQIEARLGYASSAKPDRFNLYSCRDCGGRIATIDIHEGVTPFMIGCRARAGCTGPMFSMMYQPKAIELFVIRSWFEWYRPDSLRDVEDAETRDHVASGGLLIRPSASGRRTKKIREALDRLHTKQMTQNVSPAPRAAAAGDDPARGAEG